MAKDNEVKVGVKVTDDGSLKETDKKARKASKGLGDVGANAAGADRAMKGLSAQSSNSTKNFSKMSQGLTGGLVPAYAVLAANIFAVGAAFRFLAQAADYRILIEGQQEYATITGESLKLLTTRLQDATDGQLAFAEASQSVAIARAAGLTADQIGRLGKLARNASIALGRDLTDSLNRLIRGATKGEPELLDELGIILRLETAAQKYGAQIGKAANQLNIFEKSQAITNEVLAQGESKFADLETEVNQFGKMLKSFDDLLNTIKMTLAKGLEPIATGLSKNIVALSGAFILLGSSILKSLTPQLPAIDVREAGRAAQGQIAGFYTGKAAPRFAAGTATSADFKSLERSINAKKSTVINYENFRRTESLKSLNILKAHNLQLRADSAGAFSAMALTFRANLALMQAEYGKFIGTMKFLQAGLLKVVSAVGYISLFVTVISLIKSYFDTVDDPAQAKFIEEQDTIIKQLREQIVETDRLIGKMKKRKNLLDSINQAGGFFSNFSFAGVADTFGDFRGTLGDAQRGVGRREEGSIARDYTGLTGKQREIAEGTVKGLENQLKLLNPEGELAKGVKKTLAELNQAITDADAKTADESTFKVLDDILVDLQENGTEATRKLQPFAKTTQIITNSFSEMNLALNRLKQGSTGLSTITKSIKDTGEALTESAALLLSGELNREKFGTEFGSYKDAATAMLGEEKVAEILGSATATTVTDDQLRQIGVALTTEAERMHKLEIEMMTKRTNLQADLIETTRGMPKILADQVNKMGKVSDIEAQIFEIETLRDELKKKNLTDDDVAIQKENAKLRVLEAQLQVAKDEASLLTQLQQGVLNTFATGLQTAIDGLIQGTVTVKEAFANMAKSVLQAISQILAKMAALKILSFMFPGTDFASFLAGGGYMQGAGQRKVPGYRNGGIVSEPTYMVGEGKYNEAVVPLPDGRSIPVQMKGGSGTANVTVNIAADGSATSSLEANGGDRAAQLGRAVSIAVQEELHKQQRPGGMLSPFGVS